MSALAPTLEMFFTDRLLRQQHASPHTVAAYRDTFRLLLGFAQRHLKKAPSRLDWADLDAVLITAFLESWCKTQKVVFRGSQPCGFPDSTSGS